jgi:hypothetical protein
MSDGIDQDNVAHVPVQQYQLNYYRHRELRACHSTRVSRDLLITAKPCCALYTLSTPRNLLCIYHGDNNAGEKCNPI